MVPLLIKVGVANLAAGVQVRGAVLSVDVLRVDVQAQVVRAVKVVARELKARTAIKPRKSITDSLLL
jgi:hypothetical protein